MFSPPSGGGANPGQWEVEQWTVAVPGETQYTVAMAVALDADGTPLIRIEYGGVSYGIGDDFTLADKTITWTCGILLEAGEVLDVWYVQA
jgi:hypothetical protein